jgi:hypothetical protein
MNSSLLAFSQNWIERRLAGMPDEGFIHDLLRWSDWIRAYRATAEFFDRKLAASGERQ